MKNILLSFTIVSAMLVLFACSKSNSDKMYVANYIMFDSTIRFIGFITVDTNYSTSYIEPISLDSATNKLYFRKANYSLQSGNTNIFGTFPSDIITLTNDSITVSYASPAVVGGNRFIILKGYKH